jgi:hypothetical protein
MSCCALRHVEMKRGGYHMCLKPSGVHAGSVPQGKPRLSSNADALSVFKDRHLLNASWHNLCRSPSTYLTPLRKLSKYASRVHPHP